MTRLCGLLLWRLFMLVSVACAAATGSEPLAQGATATAAPTATPSPPAETPVPLSAETIAACAVSLPNLEESPNEYYLACSDLLRVAGSASSHAVSTATAEPSVATALPPDPPSGCPVTQPPDPPFEPPGRAVQPFAGTFWYGSDALYLALPLDGTWPQLALGEKVFWWSANYSGGGDETRPAMTIRGRRLDAPDETFEQYGATNASHASFPATAMLHGLRLPAPGCWEITGAYQGETLSFVVWAP